MSVRITVEVKKLTDTATIPEYHTPGSAGFDIAADIDETFVLLPHQFAPVSTGLAFALPEGTYLRISPRSGLSVKNGINILAGVVDADYRGEIKVVLHNNGTEPFTIKSGDRIAQGVITPILQANFVLTDVLSETLRGEGGFGSTGLSR